MSGYRTPPDDVTTDTLNAALRECLVPDGPLRAATELLINHGRWINSVELRKCIEWEPYGDDANPACAWIDWSAVAQKFADMADQGPGASVPGGPPRSSSELAVLGIALSIVNGPVAAAVYWCDDKNWALVVEAVTAARGDG